MARTFQIDPKSGERRTVAYASRGLKTQEADYMTMELEGLAVSWALGKWYLWLAGRLIRVRTDHAAFTFIGKCELSNNIMTRWIIKFQQFVITWEHNTFADALSRFCQPKELDGRRRKELKIRTEGLESGIWRTLRRRNV